MYPRRDPKTELYGYWERGRWGRGRWAIPPRFNYAHNFLNGFAKVELTDGSPALIDRDGAIIRLEALIGEAPMRLSSDSFHGFADVNSAPSRYATVRSSNCGRSEWGLIDTSLAYRPLPDEVFSRVTSVMNYGEYLLLCQKTGNPDSLYGLFDLKKMAFELPIEYAFIYPSDDPIWVVLHTGSDESDSRRCQFYDLNKSEILPGRFWEAVPFSCGFGAIREEMGDSWFVDENLKPAFEGRFDDTCQFSFGLAAVFKGDIAGYIDTNGVMGRPLPYEELKPFTRFGLALANADALDWNIDIIDREGRPRFVGLSTASFWDGDFPYFEVSKNDEEFLLDITLKRIF